jgi:predicted secreted protein
MARSLFRSALIKARKLTVLLAFAFAAAAVSPAFAADKALDFKKDDHNKDVKVALRSVFTVQLPVQMGTGGSWAVASLPDILVKRSDRVKGGGTPGGTETQVFRFKATKKGSGKLSLALARPWESGKPPQDTFTLNITVE